jgi:hypothetical protein
MALAFDNLSVGKKYYLKNYGELSEFRVEERLGIDNFRVKDLHTLEIYELQDLVKYGRSDDFELWEIEKDD